MSPPTTTASDILFRHPDAWGYPPGLGAHILACLARAYDLTVVGWIGKTAILNVHQFALSRQLTIPEFWMLGDNGGELTLEPINYWHYRPGDLIYDGLPVKTHFTTGLSRSNYAWTVAAHIFTRITGGQHDWALVERDGLSLDEALHIRVEE